MLNSPFVLGTAQLGLDYGIANKTGKPSFQKLQEIIRISMESGVVAFDTATAYGDAEVMLGRALTELGVQNSAYIVTKFSDNEFSSVDNILRILSESLNCLKVPKLWAVLAHSPDDFFARLNQYVDLFRLIKQRGIADSCGVSVYSAKDACAAIKCADVDIVQMPLNAFDQRAVTEKIIEQAKALSKMLMFRSVYLQGLLLLAPEELPERLQFAKPMVIKWRALCQKHKIEPKSAAFQISTTLNSNYPVVIGLETKEQLLENLLLARTSRDDMAQFVSETQLLHAQASEKLINPSMW